MHAQNTVTHTRYFFLKTHTHTHTHTHSSIQQVLLTNNLDKDPHVLFMIFSVKNRKNEWTKLEIVFYVLLSVFCFCFSVCFMSDHQTTTSIWHLVKNFQLSRESNPGAPYHKSSALPLNRG